MREDLRTWYGWAELDPASPIEAGSVGRWRVIYYVGRYGIVAGGGLKLLFHTASDWAPLQGRDPYEENFCTVRTTGAGRLTWRWEQRGFRAPWSRSATVDVAQAGLAQGDTVTFDLGDPEGGCPGVRAQTTCERGHEFPVAVDPFGQGIFTLVPSPRADIVAGRAVRLALLAPAQAVTGEPLSLAARLEDRWGNPVPTDAALQIEHEGERITAALTPVDGGVGRIAGLRLHSPGVHRPRVFAPGLGLEAEANPILAAGAAPEYLALWGDLAGQSGAGDGLGTAEAYWRYARDAAGLDFCAHLVSTGRLSAERWQQLQALAESFNEPGRFLPLPGYLWSGCSAAGGVRHVLFPHGHGPLYRCPGEGPAAQQCCHPLSELHAALRGQDALLVIASGLPPANLERHDAQLERLLQIYGGWGEAPWLLRDALQRGLRPGLIAAGDDRTGRPGAGQPSAGEQVARGGLTCVLARAHSRAALAEALRARRCYATSGARIMLDVRADDRPQGEEYAASRPPMLAVRVCGTAEIERVDLYRDGELLQRFPAEDTPQPGWLRVRWGGAMGRDWPRLAPWDGVLRLSPEGRLRAVLPYGVTNPTRGVTIVNEREVFWRSQTAGSENGVLLHVEGGPDTQLEFHSPHIVLSLPIGELPHERQLGGEGLHVRLEPLPAGTGRRDLDLTWQETALRPGVTSYYVVITQVDGEKAWSSPIFVSI
jgi:hypothetical protein